MTSAGGLPHTSTCSHDTQGKGSWNLHAKVCGYSSDHVDGLRTNCSVLISFIEEKPRKTTSIYCADSALYIFAILCPLYNSKMLMPSNCPKQAAAFSCCFFAIPFYVSLWFSMFIAFNALRKLSEKARHAFVSFVGVLWISMVCWCISYRNWNS